jgi:hypothetical protein
VPPFRLAGAAFLGSPRAGKRETPTTRSARPHSRARLPSPTTVRAQSRPRRSVRRGRTNGKLGSALRGAPTRPDPAGNFQQPKPLMPRGGAPEQNWLRPPPSSPPPLRPPPLPSFTPCANSLAAAPTPLHPHRKHARK